MEYRGASVRRRASPADAGAPGGKRAHDPARMLWTELLARLTHVADVFSRPEIAAELRGLGIKNTETAQTLLAREYARASQIALSTGAAPRPHEVMNRARDLGDGCDLQHDFFELAKGYRLLIDELALPADCSRHRWLEGRALVHVAQADALDRRR
jgi:hypothetical protein